MLAKRHSPKAGTPNAHVSHNAFGRTRLRIPSRRHDVEYFDRLRHRLVKVRGVQSVKVNPDTASVLVMHDLDMEQLRRAGQENAIFDLFLGDVAHTPLGRKVQEKLGDLDDGLKRISAGKVDVASVTFVGLLGAGVYQALRGELLGPTSTLVADAFKLLAQTQDIKK